MDKITRALMLGEDNEAELRQLSAEMYKRTSATVLSGQSGNYGTEFGEVVGGVAVIVRFDGSGLSLYFDGKAVASGASPILCVLPRGKGKLYLNGPRNNAVALVLGQSDG